MDFSAAANSLSSFLVATPVVALLAAVSTAIFAYIRYTKEQEHQRKTMLNALFAELANVYEHCVYAAYELPANTGDLFTKKKRLRWAKHGFQKSSSESSLRSTVDIGKLGFLNAKNIQSLIQFELKLRNDNLFIDQILDKEEEITREKLHELSSRLKSRVKQSAVLLEALVESRSELNQVFQEIKGRLPALSLNV